MQKRCKNKFNEGYALPSVLLVSLLVMTLLLSILSIIYFTDRGTSRLIEKQKLKLACYSSVQMALADSVLLFSDSSNIRTENFDVLLKTRQYGFWREVIASSKGIIDSVKLRYLIGIQSTENSYFDNAIVISRPNLRASVAGNTKIVGDILGTSDQIIISNIFGEPPIKKDYHTGVKKIDNKIKSQLMPDSLFNTIAAVFDNTHSEIIIENQYELNQDELDIFEPVVVYSALNDLTINGTINSKETDEILLKTIGVLTIQENTSVKYPALLYSDSLIIIESNCNLQNIILHSKGPIIIHEGSTFKNVQIFSEDSIYIDGAQFDYPSIICLSVDDTIAEKKNKAIILENSIVNGSILLMTNTSGLSSNRTKIRIDKKSKVQGLIYSENNVELYGEVFGTVFTFNFWYYKEPTEYINWLINVNVNREKLNKWFLLPAVFQNICEYQILKEEWIY